MESLTFIEEKPFKVHTYSKLTSGAKILFSRASTIWRESFHVKFTVAWLHFLMNVWMGGWIDGLIYYFQRERGSRERFAVLLIYAFIGWFLYVPWWDIKPVILAYQDGVPTNCATWPGSTWLHFNTFSLVFHDKLSSFGEVV